MGQIQDSNNFDNFTRVLRNAGEVASSATTDYKSDGTWVNSDIYKGQLAVNIYDNKAWYRWNSGITQLVTSNYSGSLTVNSLSVSSLSSTTEKIITVNSSSGLLQNYLPTDSEWITNSTLISNIISSSNWTYNSYIGSTTGAVEGQKYQDDYFIYVYSNSVFRRYKNETPSITLFNPNSATTSQTATTSIDLVICSGATNFTLYLPTTLVYGECSIKNIVDFVVTLTPTTGTIDGVTAQTLYQYDSCNLFTYGGNYYIK